MAELLLPGQVAEPAVWSARPMAAGAEGLRFVLSADRGGGSGPAMVQLRIGAQEARALILGIGFWCEQARAATACIKGDNAVRVIAALAARPFVLAMEMETRAGISRPKAERMLKRVNELSLTREVTGVVSRMLWKFPGCMLRACEGSCSQATRSSGIGSMG